MYGQGGPHDPKGGGLRGMLKTAAPFLSAAVLILAGPDFYYLTRDLLWDFLAQRYPGVTVYAAFFALYAMAYPAAFFVMSKFWESAASIAGLWAITKLIT